MNSTYTETGPTMSPHQPLDSPSIKVERAAEVSLLTQRATPPPPFPPQQQNLLTKQSQGHVEQPSLQQQSALPNIGDIQSHTSQQQQQQQKPPPPTMVVPSLPSQRIDNRQSPFNTSASPNSANATENQLQQLSPPQQQQPNHPPNTSNNNPDPHNTSPDSSYVASTTTGVVVDNNEVTHLPPSSSATALTSVTFGTATTAATTITDINASSSSSPSKEKLFSLDQQIKILSSANPLNIDEYSNHLNKIANILLYDCDLLTKEQYSILQSKFFHLMDELYKFINYDDPINSRLYLIIERNFDVFIQISTDGSKFMEISTKTIRFLTSVLMNLNYWEIYNLLNWKPIIYHFLNLIQFDLNDCYLKFINEYHKFNYSRLQQPDPQPRSSLNSKLKSKRHQKKLYLQLKSKKRHGGEGEDQDENDSDLETTTTRLTTKQRKRLKGDNKPAGHRIIKKGGQVIPNNCAINTAPYGSAVKSTNYDPDVIHECQLPSPEEPHKLCLRRFSRKYELIRHQETVHSKKKKLFKCYVCVKQNPSIGPRIFTRHDTLAKHIRVNHKISGKEAKAEVAYSKKHAEVVEEGDITVHVGRRKTKVDFELRAHMEKRRKSKGGDNDDDIETNSEMDSDMEMDDQDQDQEQEQEQDQAQEQDQESSIAA